MGLGYATLVPTKGIPAMAISDVDGVKVSESCLTPGRLRVTVVVAGWVGASAIDHSANPICLYDISSRVEAGHFRSARPIA
jgi:hypothetical protein